MIRIALCVAFGAAVGFVASTGPVSGQAVALDKAVVGLVTISGTPADRPGPFDWLRSEPTPSVRALAEAIAGVADEGEMRAVVVRLEDAVLSTTQTEELGEAIASARAAGKMVYVVGEAFGRTDLMLGSYADHVIAQRGEALSLPGMHMEEWYLRDMLEWVGIEPSFVQIGAYKGAEEPFNRSEPSGPWEENISQLLDSLYENMRGVIKRGRELSDADLDLVMERAWFANADDGVTFDLIDETMALTDLSDELASDLGAEVSWRSDLIEHAGGMALDPSNPLAVFALLSRDPSNEPVRPSVAVVHIDGPIVDGDSSEGGLFGSTSVGSRTIRRVLDDLGEEELVRGVVIRIDSPGGSATASEVIWQAARRLAAIKPVYVSVGSMAASGGYYIAVAGDRIFVNPSSIVGSIGVVSGKLPMAGLYDKLHVNVVARSRGPRAALFGSQPWSDEEREAVRAAMTQTYDLFTSRVSAGREGIDLSRTAEGRLFTGDKAIELKMADEIGSLDRAIESVAGAVGLEQYDVLDYPGPKSLEELFEQMVPAGVSNPVSGVAGGLGAIEPGLRALVGPAWPAVRQRIDAAIMLRDVPATLLEHRILSIR